ncbi:hypothetical protein [Streptomyces aureus]
MSGDTGGGRPDPKSPKRPRPLKQARVGWPPALRELKELLYQVYLAADTPSLNEIAGDIADDDSLPGAPSRDTVHRVITDGERPGQQADVVAVATVLARRASWDAPDLAGRARDLWVQAGTAQGAGRPISDLRGDVRLVLDGGLGVHPAVATGGARDRFGILPAYAPRGHDARMKVVIDAATAGDSGIAVLVGGSSTGKTRALWEAVRELPDGWRLWHPLSPTAPDAVLDCLSGIAPKTVVWLNEAQHYLAPGPLGERVAAGLRELLHDPSRAPVLVLGTLWPEHWDTLTTRTTADPHAGARELLGRHKIDVPDTFSAGDLAALDATDPRLAQAARRATGGSQITQYLAGVPHLMDRYSAARGATLALIHAAMDARRLGAGLHLPLDWLADAALGYLDDDEYRTLDRDWLTQALAFVTTPCNGIPGMLTLVTNSRLRNQRGHRRPHESGTPADEPGPRPQYLLADYLDQHGRHHRAETIPPVDFWAAAALHAHPTDLTALGNAARDRGLYRDAAQLHKHATTHGDPHAAIALVRDLHILHPTDHHPARWAVTHATLDDPDAIAQLLAALSQAGAHQQITALLARDPAAQATLDNPDAVTRLLRLLQALQQAGAEEQFTALAERVAAHAALDRPIAVAQLLEALQSAGADEQVTRLLARNPAAHATLDNPIGVARLLRALQQAGADEQVTALAEQVAAHASLNAPNAIVALLRALRRVKAKEQATALTERAATQAALNQPFVIAALLDTLRDVRAHRQVAALLARNPAAHSALDDPEGIAVLLYQLWRTGADEQVIVLAERAAAHASLDGTHATAELLPRLRRVRADEQVAALAVRAAAQIALDNPNAIAHLLLALRDAGAGEQVTALLARNPARQVILDEPDAVARLLRALRKTGADEQVTALLARAPAAQASLDNPEAVARLLDALREAGAEDQVAALLARAPAAQASLDAPHAVARLLDALREAGADEQAAALAERAAADINPDHPVSMARMLDALREAGADEQAITLAERATAHITLDDPNAITRLLLALRDAGAGEQVTALTERLPDAGHFNLFIKSLSSHEQFRLGREPDGSAAPSWTWKDLD